MTLAIDVAIGSAAAALFTAPSDADRRAALATLAAAGPAVRIPLPGGNTGWLVTGYAHVRAVLTDPHVVKQLGLFGGPFTDELPPGVAAGLFRHMLNANPPDHGRLRRLVAAAFTRRRAEAMAPRIQQLTDALPRRRSGGRPGGPRRGARRTPAGAGHRRPARRARSRLPAVPRLDTPPGHRGARRTGRLRRRRGRHARAPARARRTTPRRPGDDLLSALVAARDGAAARGRTGSTRTS